MTNDAVPAADSSRPSDVVRRAEQVVDVLRDLRDRDGGGSAGPELDEAIREFSRVAGRVRASQGPVPVVGIARGDDNRPVQT